MCKEIADFLAKSPQTRKGVINSRKKNIQPIILCTTKLFFRSKGEIRYFPYKQKLRELTTRPALKRNPKGSPTVEVKGT